MLSETQTVTVNAVAKTLPRIDMGGRKGIFRSLVDGLTLTVSHVSGKRERATVRTDFVKTAADPLLDGVSKQYSMSVYSVIDAPPVGFSPTEIAQNAQAHVDWMDVPANLAKVVNGES